MNRLFWVQVLVVLLGAALVFVVGAVVISVLGLMLPVSGVGQPLFLPPTVLLVGLLLLLLLVLAVGLIAAILAIRHITRPAGRQGCSWVLVVAVALLGGLALILIFAAVLVLPAVFGQPSAATLPPIAVATATAPSSGVPPALVTATPAAQGTASLQAQVTAAPTEAAVGSAANGQNIYLYSRSSSGQPIVANLVGGMMPGRSMLTCARCHGADGVAAPSS